MGIELGTSRLLTDHFSPGKCNFKSNHRKLFKENSEKNSPLWGSISRHLSYFIEIKVDPYGDRSRDL